MRIQDWLQATQSVAERCGLPELKLLLESLARATDALRRAGWNDNASGAFGKPRASSRRSATSH